MNRIPQTLTHSLQCLQKSCGIKGLFFVVSVICFNFRLLKNSESLVSHPGLLVGMLDIVLNKEVKTLEMGDFRLRDDFEIWPLVLKKCTGLER